MNCDVMKKNIILTIIGSLKNIRYGFDSRCLRYMSEYSNCLMEGYGVLPSAPRQLRVSNVNEDFAIVHWTTPTTLNDTVTGYNIHYRPLATFENIYKHISNAHPPYILENLYANAEYEVCYIYVYKLWNKIPSQHHSLMKVNDTLLSELITF